MTRVLGPTSFFTSSVVPTARIRSRQTATASVSARFLSTVHTLPFSSTRSAFGASAARTSPATSDSEHSISATPSVVSLGYPQRSSCSSYSCCPGGLKSAERHGRSLVIGCTGPPSGGGHHDPHHGRRHTA